MNAAQLVHGQTDSERVFALITAEATRRDGDVNAAITAAVSWIADTLPVFSVNFVLCTATELWALRYPANHQLWIMERPAGGTRDRTGLDARSDQIHARSTGLATRPSVVLASERMNDNPQWRLIDPGELVHVDADLRVATSRPFPHAPTHELTLADPQPAVARSQQPLP